MKARDRQADTTGIPELKDSFRARAEEIRKLHFSGGGGMKVVRANTALMDRLVTSVFGSACARLGEGRRGPGWSLIAVGGYGRGELNPHSDVDIMFLRDDAPGAAPEELPTLVLHMLWDLGLDIGYSVRGVSECGTLAAQDYTIMTALLEARHLCGDSRLSVSLDQALVGRRKPKLVEEYIRQKLSERTARRKKHGDSVYLREPNIKEGAGGLRDIHTAQWIARFKYGAGSLEALAENGLISGGELKRLAGSRGYLLRLRNELHYISGHRQDVLTFELQESAAGDFGYRERSGRMAVENFMRAYFLRARAVHEITQTAIESAMDVRPARRWSIFPPTRKKLDSDFYAVGRALCMDGEPDQRIAERPELLVRSFAHYQETGVPFSANLRRALEGGIRAVKSWTRQPGSAAAEFLGIMGRPERLYETLDLMHRMKLLGRLLPEFGAVSALVQHDLYHKYTVDEHSLLSLKRLQHLPGPGGAGYPELQDALRRVSDRQALMLALLLHDTGKARGASHSEKGASLAHDAAVRLGMEPGRAELVEFLVRNHLLMSHVSQRRELSDSAVLEKFCRIVGDRERLDMLYLVSYADMSAVGPEVFNQWRRVLLRELYDRAAAYLEDKGSVVAYENKRLDALSGLLLEELEGFAAAPEVAVFLKNLPQRYLLSVPVETAAAHFRLSRGIGPGGLIIDHTHDEGGYTNLTLILFDEPGLFYVAAGALAARNMNILSANIFTGRDGLVIDTFQVTDCNKRLSADEKLWAGIKQTLVTALTGRTRVGELFPSCPVYPRKTSLTSSPPRVVVDNEASDRFTVVEVYAHDRVGLLYDITRTLYEQGCYVSSAKVDTDVDRVVDVFYLTDIFRQKIYDPFRIGALKEALAAAVSHRNK